MKWYKSLALVLAGVLCCGMFACSDKEKEPGTDTPGGTDNPGGGNTTVTVPTGTVTEPDEHLVTNGLHKVTVTETNNPFVTDEKSEYVIVSATDNASLKAALLIQSHVRAATGAGLTLVRYEQDDEGNYPVEWSADAHYIVMNVPELFAAAGLTMPEDKLSATGYYIKNAGGSVFIAPHTVTGAQYGAISFLKNVVGYEMYAEDTVEYSKSGATMPDMEIIEQPDFEFHIQGNSTSSEAVYGMGFMTTGEIFIPVAGETWHNSLNYLPLDTYNDPNKPSTYHPNWFSTLGNELCYTARGDEDEFNAMAAELAGKIIDLLGQYPTTGNITITIEDHDTVCACEYCTASRNQYGGADSAAVIKLCNAVNRLVQAHLEEEAEANGTAKREFNILFFAYRKMEKPPVVKNETTGEWEPIDGLVCDENVGVYIAPIDARYNQSFYHADNTTTKDVIEGWGAVSDKLYMWLYETNYSHYLYPINTYDTMIETYRLCKANNAIYMMNEGQYNQSNVTHFGKLKEYFNARAEFNVNDNYLDIVNDFFAGYFKDAAAPMRQYFDELQAHLRYLEVEYPGDVNGNIYNNMEQAKLWPEAMLEHWLDLIDEAYGLIAHYETEDPEMYRLLHDHINLESIFPRFATLRLYSGKYSAETLRAMQEEFRDDCADFGITMLNEGTSLDTVFNAWGL